jgi:hypothetical protein
MKVALKKLKSEIENNYIADIAAINQLLARDCETRQEISKTLEKFVEASRPHKRPSQIVEEIIQNESGDFNISSICFKYSQETGRKANVNIRSLISQAINKLKHRNPPEIIEVEKGRGSRSGTYRNHKS